MFADFLAINKTFQASNTYSAQVPFGGLLRRRHKSLEEIWETKPPVASRPTRWWVILGLAYFAASFLQEWNAYRKMKQKTLRFHQSIRIFFCTWDTSFVSQNVFCSLLIVFICLLFFLNCFGGGKKFNADLFVECLNAWKLRMGGPRPNQLGGSGSRSASNLLDFYMQKQQELHRQKTKQGGKGKSKQRSLYKKDDDPWKITDEVNDIRNQQRVGWISLVFLSFGWNIKVVLQIQMQRCF